MIPILYEKDETRFTTNILCRLRDATSVVVTEERNGLYECDFDYPVGGANYEQIQLGRIIAVEHDDTNDVQPFDIVSYTKPINGIVSFHAVHISYRQSKIVASGQNVTSLEAAFQMLKNGTPSNPFTYWTDQYSSAEFPLGDGIPRSVRECLGGTEGSILDTYGGEYEWDKFTVKLWNNRGEDVDFVIRYGVNMTDYNDETDSTESYSAIVPYWVGQDGDVQIVVKGNMVTNGAVTTSGRVDCVATDFSQEFESDVQPTPAQLETLALSKLNSEQPNLSTQSIKIGFVRLQDSGEYGQFQNLMKCKLCDRVRVEFPRYNMSGQFKIVKTVYDVLLDRFTEMELGTLSTTLSEALGIGSGTSGSGSLGGGITVLDCYPVGSYYETSDTSFDPNSAWGGTWVLDSKGRVTVGRDETIADFNTVGKTGGEKTHTLTVDEMPSHTHKDGTNASVAYVGHVGANTAQVAFDANSGRPTTATGGGQAHNNMPPYVVVNRWHRTA